MKRLPRVALVLVLLATCAGGGDVLLAQSWTQQAALSIDATFIDRVKMSVVSRAVIIVQTENDTTPNYVHRVALAKQVVSSPAGWGAQFAVAVASDTTIRATSTDAQIDARVSSVWNTFAGMQ